MSRIAADPAARLDSTRGPFGHTELRSIDVNRKPSPPLGPGGPARRARHDPRRWHPPAPLPSRRCPMLTWPPAAGPRGADRLRPAASQRRLSPGARAPAAPREEIRLRAMYPACFERQDLPAHAVRHSWPEGDAARLHAIAARRAGASWEELHAVTGWLAVPGDAGGQPPSLMKMPDARRSRDDRAIPRRSGRQLSPPARTPRGAPRPGDPPRAPARAGGPGDPRSPGPAAGARVRDLHRRRAPSLELHERLLGRGVGARSRRRRGPHVAGRRPGLRSREPRHRDRDAEAAAAPAAHGARAAVPEAAQSRRDQGDPAQRDPVPGHRLQARRVGPASTRARPSSSGTSSGS